MAATIRCDVIDHFSNVGCVGDVIVLVKKGYAIEPLEITECLSISKLFFLGKFPYNNNYKFNFISGVIVHRQNQNTIVYRKDNVKFDNCKVMMGRFIICDGRVVD